MLAAEWRAATADAAAAAERVAVWAAELVVAARAADEWVTQSLYNYRGGDTQCYGVCGGPWLRRGLNH